jgi:hypothetical protein
LLEKFTVKEVFLSRKKITFLPDMGNLRYLQADRQQFGHQDVGVGEV